ncbi:MAG: anthranilate phosphoribosyltransferase [Prevotella sp.]|nr:anthranilate phosphoribosyltransferase [Prevotella sp.]
MKEYLEKIIAGGQLTREETRRIMIGITREEYPPEQIAALLMALQVRGAAVDELMGFRDGLLETGKRVDFGDVETIDIVGTGGDGKNTFNISTCAAFVVAGAGYKVAKHGNYGSTSVSGASNVLTELGVTFSDDIDTLRRSLFEAGIAYLHAPLFAYGMKYVAPVRKALGVPTCFNLLGPLVNPSRPQYSLHGTATTAQLRLYASLHQSIGDNYGIVTGYDGYDEVSLTSEFKFVRSGSERVYTPEELGFARVKPEEISGGKSVGEAKEIFLNVLKGESNRAARDVVIANAACAICVINPLLTLETAARQARESLNGGRAMNVLRKFLDINR